jgi:hypothetical protein
MLNEPDAVLLAASVAVQVTLVTPMANIEPEAGVHTGVTDPDTVSWAVAAE